MLLAARWISPVYRRNRVGCCSVAPYCEYSVVEIRLKKLVSVIRQMSFDFVHKAIKPYSIEGLRDVKQNFRLYLRRGGASCLMNFLLEWLFRLESSDSGKPSIEDVLYWLAKVFQCTAVVHFLLLALELGLECEWRCLGDGDVLVCQARRSRLFSRTSRLICSLVLKWLVCTSLWCRDSSCLHEYIFKSIGRAVDFRFDVVLMCELTYFLYFNQFVLCDL